jgi:threonylcarbamoyladenosine tRNA methylthiotransferase CDKAL1
MNRKYIYIETYGCAANQNNSEILAGLLRQAGYEITNNIDISEIVIINSCIVKGKTESKIKRRIQDLSNTEKLLIVSGCMPETDFESLQKLSPRAIFLGTHNFKGIVKLIKDFDENKLSKENQKKYLAEENEEKVLLPKMPKNKLISITQISEGCLGDCNYCKTRLAKGKLFSYDIDKIIKSVESDLVNGAKEIWLTSQDCAAYGIDRFGESKLPELLKRILNLKGNFKVRLGMSNPNHIYPILDELIEIYGNKKMYKFLHIPIQSASDKVLKDMNRKYKIKIVEEIINRFKGEFREVVIATDIIVGYPSEEKRDHLDNIAFVEKFCPEIFNLSKFSSHKGTKAEKLKVLDVEILNARASDLMLVHREGALKSKKRYYGNNIQVFVNSKSKMPGIFEARDNNYNIVFVKGSKELLGKNIEVRIKGIGVHHMIGVV